MTQILIGPSGSGGVLVPATSTLRAVCDLASGGADTIFFQTDQVISSDYTVPTGLEIIPVSGAKISVASGVTFNYTGSVARWPLTRIFDDVGAVTGLKRSEAIWFATGDGTTDDAASLQLAFNASKTVSITQPDSFYSTTQPLTISSHHTLIFENELTEIRLVSGSGYVIQLDGGTVEATAYKHVRLCGGTLSGAGNADCDGGFYIKGVYLLEINHMHCRQFTKATAIAGLLENVFNAKVSNSRFNCGTASDDIQGDIGLKVTITDGSSWNITQLDISDSNLFQFNTRYGVAITREGSTGSIDGVKIHNNGIGHNGTAGIALNTGQLFACTVEHNHIEGDGGYGVIAAYAGSVVDISSNYIQDAAVAISYNARGTIGSNTIKGASVTPDGTQVGIAIGADAIAKIGENTIYSDWITTHAYRYTMAAGGRADFGIIQCTTAIWEAFYSSHADIYNGAIVEITDATDYSLRMLMSYGDSWYRAIPQYLDIVETNGTNPDISGGASIFKTVNTGATLMAGLANGYISQKVEIIFGDALTTVNFSSGSFSGNGGVNWAAPEGSIMHCTYDGTKWACVIGAAA